MVANSSSTPAALPTCSVIIPTYNRGSFLNRAIRSVLDQLLVGDELIVVDDGSDDDTPRVLSAFADRIVVLQGAHRGAGPARNLGIARARSELVAFLDSDDLWLPHKLELQRRLMASHPELLYCFGNFEVQFSDGSVVQHYLDRWPRDHETLHEALGLGHPYSSYAALPPGLKDFQVHEADFYSLQLMGLYVLTDTLVVRREAAGEALAFAEDLPTYEDLECFYRLARRGRGVLLDVEMARQFEHGDGRLSDLSALQKLDARLVLLERHWGRDDAFRSWRERATGSRSSACFFRRRGISSPRVATARPERYCGDCRAVLCRYGFWRKRRRGLRWPG
jgi:glycosyltransferase involved in cell wall biosynthesis